MGFKLSPPEEPKAGGKFLKENEKERLQVLEVSFSPVAIRTEEVDFKKGDGVQDCWKVELVIIDRDKLGLPADDDGVRVWTATKGIPPRDQQMIEIRDHLATPDPEPVVVKFVKLGRSYQFEQL